MITFWVSESFHFIDLILAHKGELPPEYNGACNTLQHKSIKIYFLTKQDVRKIIPAAKRITPAMENDRCLRSFPV